LRRACIAEQISMVDGSSVQKEAVSKTNLEDSRFWNWLTVTVRNRFQCGNTCFHGEARWGKECLYVLRGVPAIQLLGQLVLDCVQR
jgi:hypothetical protein